MTEHPPDTEFTSERRSGTETAHGDFDRRDGVREDDHPHFGLIYETSEELFATASSFLREGLARGDRCWYIADENSESEVREALSAAGIDVESARETGQLVIHSPTETYFEDGEFDPEAMIDTWAERASEASAHDEFERLRIVGEATWELDSGTGELIDGVEEYEGRLDDFFSKDDCIGLCMYNRERFPSETLETIIEHHPRIIYDGTVAENFYYVPSDDATTDSQSTVDHQIETLIERTEARTALEQQKRHIARQNEQLDQLKDRLLATSPTGVLVVDAADEITLANDRAAEILGVASEELAGRSADELAFVDSNGEAMPPEETPVGRVRQTSEAVSGVEVGFRRPGGERIWFSANAAPLFDADETDTGEIVVSLEDITERKRTEQQTHFLDELGQELQSLTDPDAIMATAARMLGERLGVDRCTYAEVEDDENHLVVAADYTRGDTASMAGEVAMADFGDEALRLMRDNQAYVVDDADADERVRESDRDAYEQAGIQSLVAVPLHKDGRFTAKIAVHQATPHEWQPHEVELVETVVGRCWESVQRARTMRELHESEEKYRTLFESIVEGFCINEIIFDDDGETPLDYRIIEANPKFEEYTGLVDAEGKTVNEMGANLERFWYETYGEVARTREPRHFEHHSYSVKLLNSR